MSINYALFVNNLTSDPDDYAAQVQLSGSVELEDVAKAILDAGSTVTEADIMAVLTDSIKVTQNFLLDGKRVQFGGLFEMFPRVKGIFNGITDAFDAARQSVDVAANPGATVRKTVRENAEVQKLETILPRPAPLEFFDLGSGETNGTATPGNIGQIRGHRLKYDESNPSEGIFFIADTGGAETKVTEVLKNKPAELIFRVPALGDDSYTLEVRAKFSEDGEVRTGTLDSPLMVGPIP